MAVITNTVLACNVSQLLDIARSDYLDLGENRQGLDASAIVLARNRRKPQGIGRAQAGFAPMTTRLTRWLLSAALLLTVGCDHASKHGAATNLRGGRVIELIPNALDLRYVENHDVAFSLLGRFGLEGSRGVIGLLALLTVGVMSGMWFRRRNVASLAEHLGFALALAGGIGNVLDRFTRGFVVDFIHVHHWPVFNVADLAVAVGMALVLLSGWRSPIERGPQPNVGSSSRKNFVGRP